MPPATYRRVYRQPQCSARKVHAKVNLGNSNSARKTKPLRVGGVVCARDLHRMQDWTRGKAGRVAGGGAPGLVRLTQGAMARAVKERKSSNSSHAACNNQCPPAWREEAASRVGSLQRVYVLLMCLDAHDAWLLITL